MKAKVTRLKSEHLTHTRIIVLYCNNISSGIWTVISQKTFPSQCCITLHRHQRKTSAESIYHSTYSSHSSIQNNDSYLNTTNCLKYFCKGYSKKWKLSKCKNANSILPQVSQNNFLHLQTALRGLACRISFQRPTQLARISRENWCCSQSPCITSTGRQQVSDDACEQDALMAQHDGRLGNAAVRTPTTGCLTREQQAATSSPCTATPVKTKFLLLANTEGIHTLWSPVSY